MITLPPQVAVSYPQDGQEISVTQEPQVALQAQVNDPFLAKVEFYVDGSLVGEADLAPYGVSGKLNRDLIPCGWSPLIGPGILAKPVLIFQ